MADVIHVTAETITWFTFGQVLGLVTTLVVVIQILSPLVVIEPSPDGYSLQTSFDAANPDGLAAPSVFWRLLISFIIVGFAILNLKDPGIFRGWSSLLTKVAEFTWKYASDSAFYITFGILIIGPLVLITRHFSAASSPTRSDDLSRYRLRTQPCRHIIIVYVLATTSFLGSLILLSRHWATDFSLRTIDPAISVDPNVERPAHLQEERLTDLLNYEYSFDLSLTWFLGHVAPRLGLLLLIAVCAFLTYRLRSPTRKDAFQRPIPLGYSRLLWTCCCGDELYGDFKALSRESLRNLAATLGAKILALNTGTTLATSGVGIAPLSGVESSAAASRPGDGQAMETRRKDDNTAKGDQKAPAHPAAIAGHSSSRTTPFHQFATKKFLEICVRSFNYPHVLGELDVSGYGGLPGTDGMIFADIRAKYNAIRAARPLRWLAFYKPVAGNFVRFRIDKDSQLIQASAAIMKRHTIPPVDKVRSGDYEYNPVPMDEPPMPPEIFAHYFNKAGPAHNQVVWTSRFPYKLKSSILYSQEHLAEGWGIEIEEGLNWLVLSALMLAALLLSGAVAALYGVLTKDASTAVAIGSWLTAVQTLVMAVVFFKWG